MGRAFCTLDVFTADPLSGNPLAVVLDCDGLSTEDMQAVAREFALSETVFVLPPEKAGHSAKVRIFTPTTEIPFAGHPTVGTAILLASRRQHGNGRPEDAIVVLETGIGPVRAGVRLSPGEAGFAEFDVVKLPEEAGTPSHDDRLAAALGLAPNEIGFENHHASRYTAGNPFTFVPVQGLESIGRCSVVAQHWREAFAKDALAMAFVYCRETVHTHASFHARMFAPLVLPGAEDPATGSAAAAFAAVVHRFDGPPDGLHSCLIEQGYEMGRPSAIHLEFEIAGGGLRAVRIGGHAVLVSQGELDI